MFARLFGHINSSTNFLLAIWAIVLCLVDFFVFKSDRFVFETVWGEFHFIPVAGMLIQLGLIFAIMYALQWLLHANHHLIKRHAYLPFFTVPLVLLCAGGDLNFSVLTLILLLIMGGWLSVYHGENVLSRVLNTGLLIGAGSFVDLRLAVLIVFTYVVYIIFGRFNLRTSLILLVGFFTVWVNIVGVEFILFESSVTWTYFTGIFGMSKTLGHTEPGIYKLLVLVLIGAAGLIELPKTVSRASVFKRQSYILFGLLLGSMVLLYVFFPGATFYLAAYLVTALILFVNFFQYVKKMWIRELLMWVMIGVFIIFQLEIL